MRNVHNIQSCIYILAELGVLLCAANVAAAQLRLGVMYEQGLGIKVDPKVAAMSHLLGNNSLPVQVVSLKVSVNSTRCCHKFILLTMHR